jgi:hypothetical protein
MMMMMMMSCDGGHVVAQWLRHCAANQIAGSIPDGIIQIFH